MYAIIDTGGKQYRVTEGERIRVEDLGGKVGDQVEFKDVLFVGDGAESSVGAPAVKDATVTGTIEEQGRGEKVVVFKFKRRKMYRRRRGHRQDFTAVRIDSITTAQKSTPKSKTAEAAKDKVEAEKRPVTKAAPKKAAPKKTATKKTAAKKTATKKAAPKKTAARKTAAKKTPAAKTKKGAAKSAGDRKSKAKTTASTTRKSSRSEKE